MDGIFCLKAEIAVVSLTPECTITDTYKLRKPKNTKKLLDFLRFGTDKRSIFLLIFEFKKFDKKSPGDDFLKRYCEKISIILQKTTTMDSVL